jgi:GMP synthase (glutamine-hydrolysing)
MKPLLFIKTGYAIKGIPAEVKDFEHWTAAAAAIPMASMLCVPVIDGAKLPAPSEIRGVVVSGSAAMVTDRLPWSEYTAAWLLEAMHCGVPILGICYGHQLLAHALGGAVDYHPRGREMGTKSIHTTLDAASDELFAGLPSTFHAHTTHLQSVSRLPAGAMVLASNEFEPYHAVRFAPRVWGVQFHPEFTGEFMTHYLRIRSDALRNENHRPEQLLAEVRETPVAASLLQRFARLA